VHVAPNLLVSIYLYVAEAPDKKQGGSVTFVGEHGKLFASLRRTHLPAGTWNAKLSEKSKLSDLVCAFPKDLDPALLDAVKKRADKELIITWGINSKDKSKVAAQLKEIDRMLRDSVGRTLRIVVAYTRAATGNSRTLTDSVPLTAGDNTVLKDPNLAVMYLQFVEHFGKVPVDFTLATDGLTAEEIAAVEQDRPPIIDITNLFVQCVTEFNVASRSAAAPPPTFENLRAMAEAIFFQRLAKNDLARRNQLAISIGTLIERTDDGKYTSSLDIGVVARTLDQKHLLLYDRDGAEIRFGSRPLDSENRAFDMQKLARDTGIPTFSIEVENQALYQFLRNIEQQLGDPMRDVEALGASLYKHTLLITFEMKRINGKRIAARILDFAPAVIFFFVAHAVLSVLVKRGHPAAVALSALLVGAGHLLGIDFGLMQLGTLAAAGRHFHHMELLHREDGSTRPKITALSATHLTKGADLLIQAMEEFIALGVILIGTLGVGKISKVLADGIARRAQARVKVTVENGTATKIESVKPETQPKIGRGVEESGSLKAGEVDEAAPKEKAIETDDAHAGEAREGKIPQERSEGATSFEVEADPNLELHLREVDPSVPAKNGIGGGHNKLAFEQGLAARGGQVTTRVPHPTMPGVEAVEYKMPKLDAKGKPASPPEFKAKTFQKTTYDPAVISDADFARLGMEAAADAKRAGGGKMPREWTGRASNGVIFRGYLDAAGKVKSFFPDVDAANSPPPPSSPPPPAAPPPATPPAGGATPPAAPAPVGAAPGVGSTNLRLTLDATLFPAQAFFNAVANVDFVRMVQSVVAGAGWVSNFSSCDFPDEDGPPQFSGVGFQINDESVVVSAAQFKSILRQACDAQKARIPAQGPALDAELAKLR
jgi:hypothetical protein